MAKLSGADLRLAANEGSLDYLKEVLKAGVDPNSPDKNGFTSLHSALTLLPHDPDKDPLAIVKILVEAGADVNATTNNGQTVLFEAAAEGLPEVVEYLIARGAKVDTSLSSGWNALHYISDKTKERPLNYRLTLTRDGKQVTLTDPDEIRQAMGKHPDDEYFAYVKVAEILIKNGINLNQLKKEQQQTPLFDAVAQGS